MGYKSGMRYRSGRVHESSVYASKREDIRKALHSSSVKQYTKEEIEEFLKGSENGKN